MKILHFFRSFLPVAQPELLPAGAMRLNSPPRINHGNAAVRPGRAEPLSHSKKKSVSVSANFSVPPLAIRAHILWDSRFKRRTFGEIAIETGELTPELVEELLSEQSKKPGKRIGDLAIAKGYLKPDQVRDILARQRALIYVDERHVGHPQFLTWADDLRLAGIDVMPKAVTVQELARLREDGVGVVADDATDAGLDTLNKSKRLLTDCAIMRGNDVHILVREKFAEVQLRIKGDLKVVAGMTRSEAEAMIRAICSGLTSVKETHVNPHEFQDYQISGDALPGSGLSSIRIIRGPCYPTEQGGQFLVARLQYKQSSSNESSSQDQDTVDTVRPLQTRPPSSPEGEFRLPKMGYTALQIALLERMTRMPSGIILVTGPTGSGKTSTLFELMAQLARLFPELRQVTVEQPVEYPMPWAVQLLVTGVRNDEESGAQFLKMIRTSLRMDPDTILVGELRGADESVAAVQAAMTGHLALSTIHVTDPYMTIDRLETMDQSRLARKITCDHKLIRGIVAQRLVSLLCPKCKVSLNGRESSLPPGMLDAIKAWGSVIKESADVWLRGPGCSHCHFDKIIGAQAVAEVIETDATLMRDFIEHGTDVARRNHRRKKGADFSMLGNAMHLVYAGLVDPRDAERGVDVIVAPEEE